jgi:hypothetical protein
MAVEQIPYKNACSLLLAAKYRGQENHIKTQTIAESGHRRDPGCARRLLAVKLLSG